MRRWTSVPITRALPRVARLQTDTGFARVLVAINAGVPFTLLGWDAYRHELGVNGVNFAIRTTGLLGLVFLLLSLTVTPVRRLTGWNALIAVRRTLGLSAFFYLCVHLSIFFVWDRAASLGSALHEILLRRYLQVGVAAFVLLVTLAVTSTDSMVERLGAKRWKALHRLTYLATSLGALHYYLLVKADVRQPLAFAAALTVLLGFRPAQLYFDSREKRAKRAAAATAMPRSRVWSGELRVTQIREETPDVRTLRLQHDGLARLPFVHQPGQYLNVALTIDGERVNRSYTIASSPTQSSYCEMTVKRMPSGRASRHLHDAIREGDTVQIAAPAGRFVFTGIESDGVVLIAGGVGITPLMAVVRYLTDRSWAGPIHLVFGARKRSDVIFADELARLERRFPNLHVVVTLSGEQDASWSGHRGRISSALLQAVGPDLKRLPVYLCGPEAMMAETSTLLIALGVLEGRIKTEAFVSAATAAVYVAASGRELAVAPDLSAVEAAASLASGAMPTVYFQRSMKVAALPPDKTILEVAEDAGLDIPFECRSGICGQCKTRLLAGRVTMEVDDALSAGDKAKGIVLACQARSSRDVAVDA
jgi:ferredoxin-NADP reductase/DMSO/TMAO reductase YedYZ heme-binding membrane subunit